MRKTRLTIGLMTALLSVGTLSGCDNDIVKYSPEGTLISYTVGDTTTNITADEIFAEYYNDSDKYQSIFEAIKSIIVRNYFTIEDEATLPNGTKVPLGKSQLTDIDNDAQRKVDSDKHQAQLNAQNNSTNYDKELESILSSKGVETLDELKEKYLDELKAEKFDENYYKYFMEEIKNGAEQAGLENFWTGYFKDMLPYHVSHILVKLSDGSSNNYYNGTVSEENCEKLYKVVEALKNGTDTFQVTAGLRSDDTGSKAKYGDLGIMDYSTGFVNEFKLGVYAFENLYGAHSSEAAESKINIPGSDSEGIQKQYSAAVEDAYEDAFPTVDVKVFKELFDVRKETKSKSDEEIMNNSTLVYPRNIIYNKYLNRHSFAFVTNDTETGNFGSYDTTNTKYPNEGATGFHTYNNNDGIAKLNGKTILSTVVAGQMRPILMVRAGTSDYQGIHFIVVNRDPFVEVENGVTTTQYYTTYHLNQDGYPVDQITKNPLQTYVNFNGLSGSESNSRADSLVSTLKSFDSDKLSKYIFKKYMAKEQIKICDENLNEALNRWIDNSITSKERETTKTWENLWSDYVGTLRKQNDARNKLMPQVCRIGFEVDTTVKMTRTDFEAYCDQIGLSATEKQDALDAFDDLAENNLLEIPNLYNKKGALCNDGKTYK